MPRPTFRPFLTARWQHLLLANYRVDAEVLQPYVPLGTRLDTFAGDLYLSLVAFLFDDTRLLGIPVPGHRRFEEVNLRFYVAPEQHPEQRAVCFIREIVPRRAIPWVANTLFYENYVAWPMSHRIELPHVDYAWQPGSRRGRGGGVRAVDCRFSAEVNHTPLLPEPNSLGEFITEHYWGYAKCPGKTLEYQVEHPQWPCTELTDFTIDVDFAATYGPEFAFLQQQPPASVLYAVGSEVSISFPRRLPL